MSDLPVPFAWQREQWQQMLQLFDSSLMPHAWLFSGPAGIGKRQFACALTAMLLCENRETYACGKCRSCLQLSAGHHPNFIYLQRETDEKSGKQKRDISIEQVRDLNERLALSSHYGQAKIAVIDPADALNQSSVNAILKTIEEPPADSYLFLICERPSSLAPTLRSRCQKLRFSTPSHADSLEWLGADQNARLALEESFGAPLKARELLDSGMLERGREWAIEISKIAAHSSEPLQLAVKLCANKISAKDDAADFLRWMLAWLTTELRNALKSNGAYKPSILDTMIRETLEAQRRLSANGVPQLILESLLVGWWHLGRSSKMS